jgi:uncharacterized RDD family membrane protein YckC/tetratricopeptide (TPR) repeat protein
MMKKLIILLLFLIPLVFKGNCQTANEYYESGLTKYNYNDYTGAVADCNKAIEINPEYELAFFLRGKIKTIIHDYKYAINNLTKAIEINPQHAEAYYYMGIAKCEIGQKESGCLDINKAVELGFQTGYEAIKKYCTNISDAKPVTSNEPIGIKAFLKNAAEKSGITYNDAKADNLIKAFDGDNEKIVRAFGEKLGYTGEELEYFRNQVFGKYKLGTLPIELVQPPQQPQAQIPETLPMPATSANVPIQTQKINLGKLQSPVSSEEFAKRIKKKYPEFKDVDDSTLVSKVIEKYPYYKDKVNLSKTSSSTTDQTKSGQPELPAIHTSTEKQYNSNEHRLINQTVKTESSISHFQNEKIRVGDTFIDLPIPSGFVKVDDKMGVLLESAKKLCPETNTLLAYYISEADYANFLVDQSFLIDKYILIESFNEIKYTSVSNKDYKQFLKSFKNKYIAEFKETLNNAGIMASENISKLEENLKMENISVQPFGICYESQNSVSYGIISKYDFIIEDDKSEDYIVAGISTITKIQNKPIFLYVYKTYNCREDISSLETINSAWLKEIDRRQSPVSFLSDFDYKNYIEVILAILSLSFIWAIYFATKKIHKKMKTKKVSEKVKIENEKIETVSEKVDTSDRITEKVQEKNETETEYLDFRSYIKETDVKPQGTRETIKITNPEFYKASRSVRFVNFLIDSLIVNMMLAYCIGFISSWLGFKTNLIAEHPYIFGVSLMFSSYFIQEYFWGITIGKLITRTRIVNSLGGKPTAWEIFLRTVLRFIPFEPISFLSSNKRGWHDTISDTYVINDYKKKNHKIQKTKAESKNINIDNKINETVPENVMQKIEYLNQHEEQSVVKQKRDFSQYKLEYLPLAGLIFGIIFFFLSKTNSEVNIEELIGQSIGSGMIPIIFSFVIIGIPNLLVKLFTHKWMKGFSKYVWITFLIIIVLATFGILIEDGIIK